MSAFTDAEKLAYFMDRKKICSQKELSACLEHDKAMARILSNDPNGTLCALVNEAMRLNRSERDRKIRAGREERRRIKAYEETGRWPYGGRHPDEPDWADLGIPTDEYGDPIGIGDD